MVNLPPLPNRELLADLCLEVSATEGVQPFAVEKDFYLTRLIWALAQQFDDRLLLKGGTLLSKVDLGYRRMSEDVDLVIPWSGSRTYRGTNAGKVNPVRDALKALAPLVGLRFERYDGYPSEKHAHVVWELPYESSFGPQAIDVEVALRPVLRPPRRAPLSQLLNDPLAGDYGEAYCWALDADEARAEKARAAFTRAEIRDYYDLDQLLRAGKDFDSEAFRNLVDQKLAELRSPPLRDQLASFGMTAARRKQLDAQGRKGLRAVVRAADESFDLDAVLAHFDALWGKDR